MATTNATQSDTKIGPKLFLSGEDLTGKEARLVKMGDGGTKANVLLPTADADFTPLLVVEGDVSGALSKCQPFTGEKNHRVLAKGTGSAGVRLVAADPATPADKGKLRAIPGTSGTYIVRAIAEEDFVDGQLVLCRPCGERAIVVP